MSFLFCGFKVKSSWIVTYSCHVLGAAEMRKTVLVPQGLRAWVGDGEREERVEQGRPTLQKALSAVCDQD